MSGQPLPALGVFCPLFVPGDRPDRFAKAVASGADAVILDLEDAVAPAAKAQARAAALAFLREPSGVPVGVRVNSPRTAQGCADIVALAEAEAAPAFIAVPKAETAIDLEILEEALEARAPLLAIIESPRGVREAAAIAAKAQAGLLFGGADYAAAVGAHLEDELAMLFPRGAIVAAAAEAGRPALDVPYLAVADAEGLRASTRQALALGFTGRACIHPAQTAIVREAFRPRPEEVERARAILAAAAAGPGALLHEGKLVDAPVLRAARRTLARAGLGEP